MATTLATSAARTGRFLDPRSLTTARTGRVHHDRLDRHLEPGTHRPGHLEDVHLGQSYQQLARARWRWTLRGHLRIRLA